MRCSSNTKCREPRRCVETPWLDAASAAEKLLRLVRRETGRAVPQVSRTLPSLIPTAVALPRAPLDGRAPRVAPRARPTRRAGSCATCVIRSVQLSLS